MRRLAGLGFAWSFLFAVALVHAQNPLDAVQQFSAKISGGPTPWNKKQIYRSGNLMRTEWGDEYRITRLVEHKSWFIDDKRCAFGAAPDIATYPFSAFHDEFTMERSPVVTKEVLNGHSTKVESVTFKPKNGMPVTIKLTFWEAEELNGFPIQIQVESSIRPKFLYTFSDIKVERPDPKLFELPGMCANAEAEAEAESAEDEQSEKAGPPPTAKPPSKELPKPPQ